MPSWTAGLADGYRLQLSMVQSSQSQSGNYSNVAWSVAILKGSGSGKWAGGPHYWSTTINGVVHSGSIGSYDFRNYSSLTLGSGTDRVNHNSDGTKTVSGSAGFNDNDSYGELGDASVSGSMALTRISRLPSATRAPSGTNPDQISTTSIRYRFSGPSDTGGSSIKSYQAQRATNSGFTTGVVTVTSSGTTTFTGLTPGTTYYFRSRAQNSVGWGPYGASANAKTLAANAPSLAVGPYVNGLAATVKVIPPAGVTNPEEWTLERRVAGTTTPVTTVKFEGTFTYLVSGLTPGTAYEWRTLYKVGGVSSPYSAWLKVTQPAPNTNPGDYFDGSTVKAGTVYSWEGTANNSVSRATGKVPTGWSMTTETSAAGEAVLYRQAGGRSQSYCARLSFVSDAAGSDRGAGVAPVSPGRVAVAEGATYVGSIYVQSPFRTQAMVACIRWFDSTGALMWREYGTYKLIPESSSTWTRLTVTSTPAVPGAAWIIVQAVDVQEDEWSPWKSGDFVLFDDAMITLSELYSYFDGNTKDSVSYDYSWTGTANASTSQRVLTGFGPDPFADPDCAVVPMPPRPPAIDTDCITEVGVWRRYWAVISPQNMFSWIADLPTITITTGESAARQVRVRAYENPLGLDPVNFPAGANWESEQIISYMPPNATYVLNGVDETLQGTLNGGATWTNLNHLLYGTGNTPASWPVLRCGFGYLIAFDVPVDAELGLIHTDIDLTRRF